MEKLLTLTELAKKKNINQDGLISLAAQGKFPVFIIADNWYAHTWKKLKVDDDHNEENINFGDFIRETSLQKPIQLNHEPIQIKASSLVAYQINKTLNVGSFEARDIIQGPDEYYFEFRLCDPSDFSKPFSISIDKDKLVVKEYTLPIIDKLLHDELIIHETELTVHERKKLLKVIGSLAMVLTDSAQKYKYGGKPNVSQISNSILDTFETFESKKIAIKKTGLSDSILRDVIREGLDEILKD